jgi:integrase
MFTRMADYKEDYTGPLIRPEYFAPTLVRLSAKGGKYYVCVTMPEPLRTGSQKQMMRSTGTTDLRAARSKLVPKANEIYAAFDQKLAALHRGYQQQVSQPGFTQTIGDFSRVFTADPFLIQTYGLDKDPEGRVLSLLPAWITHLENTNQGSHKERTSRKNKLEEFVKVIGNLHVEDIKKQHAYQYAQWLNDEGKGNKTIRSLTTKVAAFLTWCEQTGRIENSPFVNLKLKHYGKTTRSFLPLDPDEMESLFAQPMEAQDRLCLALLAVTGARLDEIALLDWSQVKKAFGITYLDLRPDEIQVKTDGSHRVIPVHSKLAPLLEGGSGRVFDYKVDEDGKSQNAASKQLMPYIHAVRNSERKVVHSLRGTFKQMLENAGVTTDMAEKLETGEITFEEIDLALQSSTVSKRMNDKITGHSSRDVAGKYGFGPLLILRANAIEKLNVSFLGLEKVLTTPIEDHELTPF